MFEHPNISQPHQIVLTMALRAHTIGSGVNPLLLSKLYLAAQANLKEPANEKGVLASVLRGEKGTLSTATDMETGIFIQLAVLPDQPSPSLTIGKKWAMEGLNKTLGNYSTTYW